jgi:hypothetical protein
MSTMICGRRVWAGVPEDTWEARDGKRRCSHCGSLHPNDVLSRLAFGEVAIPTDKSYKLYVGDAHDKVYFQHFEKVHMEAFIELYNRRLSGGMTMGVPGHFYRMPFFMTHAEPEA